MQLHKSSYETQSIRLNGYECYYVHVERFLFLWVYYYENRHSLIVRQSIYNISDDLLRALGLKDNHVEVVYRFIRRNRLGEHYLFIENMFSSNFTAKVRERSRKYPACYARDGLYVAKFGNYAPVISFGARRMLKDPYAVATLRPLDEDNSRYIEAVNTNEKHRRKHYQIRIFKLLIGYARSRHIRLWLRTGRNNLAAQSLYEKVGMHKTSASLTDEEIRELHRKHGEGFYGHCEYEFSPILF